MSIKRIHIVGSSSRTGTTLMAEAMRACFEIDYGTDHHDSIFVPSPPDGNIFLSKHPHEIVIVGPLLKLMPELYVIFMVRDPRDVITSKHSNDPDRFWAGLKYWKMYTVFGRKLKDHPRFITVRYEDLASKPDKVQTQIMSRMPFLVKKAPFSLYHQVARPSEDSVRALHNIRPIQPDGVSRWRKHLPRVAGQLAQHGSLTQDLIEFGYEKDDSWLVELKGTTPDTSSGHYPEYFSGKNRRRMWRKRTVALVKGVFNRVVRGRKAP